MDFIRNGNFQKGSSTSSSKESKMESAQNIHSVEDLESRWRVVGKQRYSNHSSCSLRSASSASSDTSSMMVFKDFVNQMTIGQAQQQQQRNLMNILNAAAVANKNLIKPMFQMQQPQHFHQNQYAAAKDGKTFFFALAFFPHLRYVFFFFKLVCQSFIKSLAEVMILSNTNEN